MSDTAQRRNTEKDLVPQQGPESGSRHGSSLLHEIDVTEDAEDDDALKRRFIDVVRVISSRIVTMIISDNI